MKMTLIGMAGIGKSTWSARLADRGFLRIDCDRMIAKGLSEELEGAKDLIASLGAWMGLPWEERYTRRSDHYHRLEREVMSRVVKRLEEAGPEEDMVLDTAGSVIYTGEKILKELGRLTTVVHLAASEEVRRHLLEDYLKRPGPVLWQGLFRPRPGESNRETLSRCYPALLEDRERRYRALAHISLDHALHRRGDLTTEGFLDLLGEGGIP